MISRLPQPTAFPPPPEGRSGWPWTTTEVATTDAGTLWPRITIVTPSFNQGAFIEETIRSILLQGYPNLEYIIIDGGSTDCTMEVVGKYSAWITHAVSEPDRGQSHAINKGLILATGEWFNWINSDDFLAPGALFALAEAAIAIPGRVVVSGVTANLREDTVFSRYAAHVAPVWPDALFSLRVNQPGSLLHLPSVQAAGGVAEDLRLVMDLDLWLRLLRMHGPEALGAIDNEVATYRYHHDSKTCSADDVFALEEFGVLIDLAASVEGLEVPHSLASLRARSPAARRRFVGSLPVNTAAAERAWLRRLVVDDSLLFRAVRQTASEKTDAFSTFEQLLNEITPALRRHYPRGQTSRILAQACLCAMQLHGQVIPLTALRVFSAVPSWTSAKALARLLLRR